MPRLHERMGSRTALFRYIFLVSALFLHPLAPEISAQAAPATRAATISENRSASSRAQKKHSAMPARSPADQDKTIAPLVEHRHGIEEMTSRYSLTVEYPSFDMPAVDGEIALWARRRVDVFTGGLEEIPPNDPSHFTLTITYQYIQPSANCSSVLFFIRTETGGPQPDWGMATFTYDMHSGKALEYSDIFESPQALLPLLSSYSRETLASQPWAREHMSRIQTGTSPDALNFTFFAITPQGMSVYFPPGQAGPISEGTLAVNIPLEKLRAFHPQLSLWGNAPAAVPSVVKP